MIRWYVKDKRFQPGTVADQGDIRLTLRQYKGRRKMNGNRVTAATWRLLLEIRTYEENGVEEGLKRAVVVAQFTNCSILEEAQERSENWLKSFIRNMQ